MQYFTPALNGLVSSPVLGVPLVVSVEGSPTAEGVLSKLFVDPPDI